MTRLCKTIKASALLSVLSIFFPCLSLQAAEDKPAWQVEWEKSVQAAKKEGQLVNYGGEEITHPEILKAFNKDYPEIKVTTAGGHGSELGARILAERRADKFLVDLYAGGPTTPYRVLYLSKALDPITPLFLFPEITDQSKWFTGKHIYADPDNRYLFLFEGSVAGGATIYVNTRHVNTAEFKSYWDLLQPKWKRKILFMDPKSSSLGLNAATSLFNDPDLGPEFLKRLFGEMDVAISGNRRQGTDWLSSGKYYICFACRDTEMAIKQGLPVGEVDPLSFERRRERDRRRQQQRAGVLEQGAPSQRRQGFHQLVSLAPGANPLAKSDEQGCRGRLRFDADRHSQRRRAARLEANARTELSLDRFPGSEAGS